MNIKELIARVRDYDLCNDNDIDTLCDKTEKLLILLENIFDNPGPVCENAGSYSAFAYFWKKDWDILKERWNNI